METKRKNKIMNLKFTVSGSKCKEEAVYYSVCLVKSREKSIVYPNAFISRSLQKSDQESA